MHRPRGMTLGAGGGEDRLSFVVEDRFGHDGTRRVSRAQKQNIVMRSQFNLQFVLGKSGSYEGIALAMPKARRPFRGWIPLHLPASANAPATLQRLHRRIVKRRIRARRRVVSRAKYSLPRAPA